MVRVHALRGRMSAGAADLVLVPLAEGNPRTRLARLLGPRLAGTLERRLRRGDFRGRADELFVHHGEHAVVLLGLGPAPTGVDAWRRAGAR